jgi:hypothetical protein
MAMGRPRKWATARITEPVELGKSGIEIVLWDKWGRQRMGTVIVSVGGVRWYPYKAKRPYRVRWDKLTELAEDRGRRRPRRRR